MAFTPPTAITLEQGAWVGLTGAAPSLAQEQSFAAAIGNPPATNAAGFDVAYTLSISAPFQAQVSQVAGYGSNATTFMQALSQNLSGSPIQIPQELSGFVNWLQASPTSFWGAIAGVFIDAVLGQLDNASLVNAGLTPAQIAYFGTQVTAAGDRAYIGSQFANAAVNLPSLLTDSYAVKILLGVDNTANSVSNAQGQLNAAVASGDPTKVTGQAPTLILTTGPDVPPAYATAVNNAVFFAPDVAGGQTLTAGDILVSTGLNATLSVIANNLGTSVHSYTGFTTTGIPNLKIQNLAATTAAVNFDGSGAAGLTNITSVFDGTGGDINLNNIQNQVALNVNGSVNELVLNYANPVAGTQALNLVNAVQNGAPGVNDIDFGTNAPTTLAVSLTGSNNVTIDDPALTSITVTTTDAGGNNKLVIQENDGASGVNSIVNADFSAVAGTLNVTFQNDALANGSTIKLGANDTLNIGQSNNVGHGTDAVNVTGNGGLYNITLGNQHDTVTLGVHGAGDTLTFIQPNSPLPTGPAPENIINANIVNDNFNFSVGGFSTAATNPAAGTTGVFALIAAGGATTTQVGAGTAAQTFIYPGAALATLTPGTNLIIDQLDTSAAAVQTDIRGAGLITFATTGVGANTTGPANFNGAFLIAYQGTDGGVHIAEATVTGAAVKTTVAANVFDVVDLVGQNLAAFTSSASSHLHFVA